MAEKVGREGAERQGTFSGCFVLKPCYSLSVKESFKVKSGMVPYERVHRFCQQQALGLARMLKPSITGRRGLSCMAGDGEEVKSAQTELERAEGRRGQLPGEDRGQAPAEAHQAGWGAG